MPKVQYAGCKNKTKGYKKWHSPNIKRMDWKSIGAKVAWNAAWDNVVKLVPKWVVDDTSVNWSGCYCNPSRYTQWNNAVTKMVGTENRLWAHEDGIGYWICLYMEWIKQSKGDSGKWSIGFHTFANTIKTTADEWWSASGIHESHGQKSLIDIEIVPFGEGGKRDVGPWLILNLWFFSGYVLACRASLGKYRRFGNCVASGGTRNQRLLDAVNCFFAVWGQVYFFRRWRSDKMPPTKQILLLMSCGTHVLGFSSKAAIRQKVSCKTCFAVDVLQKLCLFMILWGTVLPLPLLFIPPGPIAIFVFLSLGHSPFGFWF